MISPIKLAVIVCGAAAGLAVAPYLVNQALPVDVQRPGSAKELASVGHAAPAKADLPVMAPGAGQPLSSATPQPTAAIAPVAATPIKAVAAESHSAELQLSSPALPTPAPVAPSLAPRLESPAELTLPSLTGGTQVASAAMPTPSLKPKASPTPAAPMPTPEIPYRSEVEAAQKLMKELGLATGKVDGKLGPNTKAAVSSFQKKHGLEATGEVSLDLVAQMEKAVAALPTPTPKPESKVEISDAEKATPAASDSVETSAKDGADSSTVPGADDPDAVIVRKGSATASTRNSDKTARTVAEKTGASKPKVDPGPVPTLQNQKDVRAIQEQLKIAGTYDGPVDGRWGDLTRAAMREFQEKAGVEVTGKPNKETWLAMHSGVVQAKADPEQSSAAKSEKSEKATASADKSEKKSSAATIKTGDDELKISSADSAISSDSEDESAKELVVSVNGDGVADPAKIKPLATPASVSALSTAKKAAKDSAGKEDSDSDEGSVRVKVSTPANSSSRSRKESSADADGPSDLAVAAENKDDQIDKLRKELKQRRELIQSVSNDSAYEAKKYAPKMLETVNSMVDNFKIETVSNNPAEARARLAKIDAELDRAKKECVKQKATETVDGVRDAYNALKKSFPTRIKALSLKDDEQKAQREELTELVAKVDLGFNAMEKDYKKGNYDPIFKNGKDFRNTIEEINRSVSDVYVKAQLEEKDTAKKLSKDEMKQIKEMQSSEQSIKAADKLDAAMSSNSSKRKS